MYVTFITTPQNKTTYYLVQDSMSSELEGTVYGPFKSFNDAKRHAMKNHNVASTHGIITSERAPSSIAQRAIKPEPGPWGGRGRGQGRKPIDPNGETEIVSVRLTSAQLKWLKTQGKPGELMRDYVAERMSS